MTHIISTADSCDCKWWTFFDETLQTRVTMKHFLWSLNFVDVRIGLIDENPHDFETTGREIKVKWREKQPIM